MSDFDGREEIVPVFLTCVRCRKTETIHVFRDRGLAERVSWECLDCQKLENPMEGRPETGSGHTQVVRETR